MEDLFLRLLQLFRAQFELTPGEIEIIGAVDRYQMHVSMRDFQPYHGKTTTIAREGCFDRLCNGPGKQQQLRQVNIRHIEKIVNLYFWYHQRVSFPQRKYI